MAEQPEQETKREIDRVRLVAAGRRRRSRRNLAVTGIPMQVLSPCENGYDDYSLQVESFPQKLPEPGQQGLFGNELE